MDEVECVVVGAGVVGLSCALWLQSVGHRVTLADPDPPLPGASYRTAASYGNACTMAFGACIPVATPGVLRQLPRMLLDRRSPLALFWRDLPGMLPWLAAFLRASTPAQASRIVGVLGALLRLAEQGHAPLIAQSGARDLVRRNPCLYLFRTPAAFDAAARDIELRRREGVRMSLLDAPAIRREEPGLAPLYHRAVRFDDTYFLDTPERYAQLLLASFLQHGGQLVQARADHLAAEAAGLVVHAGAQRIPADRVVVACGAWSGRLVRTLGDRVLLDTERGYHVVFPEDGARLNGPCCYPEHGFYMTPLRAGLRAAGTVELGGLGRPARPVRTDCIAAVARELVTGLGPQTDTWLGFRPSMPDSLPTIGFSPSDRRVVHAFGHGHIGLTLAGITGRLVTEMLSGLPTSVDTAPLRADRLL